MTFKKHLLFITAVLAVSAFTPAAMADDAGEIKYRQSIMKSMGGHMGAIAGILKQETGNNAHLQMHSEAIMTLANITGTIFPKGSDFGETEALPAIWEKPADFAAAVKMLQDAANTLGAATMSGDMAATGAAFGGLGKACKNCHENFREKKMQ